MTFAFSRNRFRCAKCGKSKPLEGRATYLKTRKDTMGRWCYSYQCADCKAALSVVESSTQDEACQHPLPACVADFVTSTIVRLWRQKRGKFCKLLFSITF